MELKINNRMMKQIIVLLSLIFLLTSCQFCKKNDNKKLKSFSIKYENGEIIKGFKKNGVRDSVLFYFRKSGILRYSTYYINGKENGYRREYTELGNEWKSYFMQNGIPKTKHKIFYITRNSEDEIGYFREVYFNNDTVWTFVGALVMDTNFQVYNYYDIANRKSTNYFIEGDRNKDGLFVISSEKNKELKIRFFRLEMKSKVSLKIGELENLNLELKSIENHNIDSSGVFIYQTQSNMGWHYLRGEFEETIKDGQRRIIPIYFNYYVP